MEEQSTHIVFDGKRVLISPNLFLIFDFLQKIEKEINALLDFEKKLNDIRAQHLETLGLVQVLAKVVTDNGLDFKYTFKENPDTIAEKLSHYYLTRVEMITLFAGIETLMCLYTAYIYETDDDNEIRVMMTANKHVKVVINELILSDKNEYYYKNKQRLKKINADQIRKLRNRLTHFFSVQGINIIPDILSEKARKLEKEIGNNLSLISPIDLKELYTSGSLLLLKTWSNDCINNKQDFERKIKLVKNVIQKEGAVLIEGDKINI